MYNHELIEFLQQLSPDCKIQLGGWVQGRSGLSYCEQELTHANIRLEGAEEAKKTIIFDTDT